MIRGMYTAAAGAVVAEHMVDVIANNLANVDTAGFKRALLQVQSQEGNDLYRFQTDPSTNPSPGNPFGGIGVSVLVGRLGSGSEIFDTPTNYEQGTLHQTGNELDFGLYGPGFFAVRDGQGTIHYTRDGSFIRAADGSLVTVAGDQVLDANRQPIQLPSNGVAITSDRTGNLTSNGQILAKLGIFDFRNQKLVRAIDANRFSDNAAGIAPDTRTEVVQSVVEKSNADVVESVVQLINAERWFDANEKVITTEDQAAGVAIQNVGRTTVQ